MNDGKFKKGNSPWNKGKKDFRPSPETEFKKGQTAGEKNNTWKGGVQRPKNDCVHLYNGVGLRIRRPRKIYEDAYGEIPKGFLIRHIDGDKDNDELTNLIAISRSENLKLNNENRKTLK